jgi:hypothetical protein
MIDQGLAAAVLTFASVLAVVGVVVLLALAARGARSPLAGLAQRTNGHRAAPSTSRDDVPLHGTPHPAH